MANDFKTLSPEYSTLWDTMEIVRDHAQIDHIAEHVLQYRANYEAVEKMTGVPWYLVGIFDIREGGGGCCTHLHNGDSLSRPTVNVPANRPPGKGPFTWVNSAVDALKLKKFDQITEWTVEQIAWCCERMNGFGYRSASINIPSPYLWGGTNHQQRGKYIRDHVFSKSVMDPQIGCMPLLKALSDKAGFELVSAGGATADPQQPSPASNRKAEPPPPDGKPLVQASAGGGLLAMLYTYWHDILEFLKQLHATFGTYSAPLVLAGLGAALLVYFRRTPA